MALIGDLIGLDMETARFAVGIGLTGTAPQSPNEGRCSNEMPFDAGTGNTQKAVTRNRADPASPPSARGPGQIRCGAFANREERPADNESV